MELQEFSDQFDILYNNITSNQAPGLNEYEKSVFLTKAQDEIIKAYFNPRSNKTQEGFDSNPKRQIDFSMLIRTEIATEVTGVTTLYPLGCNKFFSVPDKVMMFINESLRVIRNSKDTYLTVVALSFDEYSRLMSKPFKRPLKNQAWRLITNTNINIASAVTYYGTIASKLATRLNKTYEYMYNLINKLDLSFTAVASSSDYYMKVGDRVLTNTGTLVEVSEVTSNYEVFTTADMTEYSQYINRKLNKEDAVVELIPGPVDTIATYTIRYVKRPQAIILAELEGVTIDGVETPQECELDPILHQEILQRAVELAKSAFTGDLNSTLSLGINSETDKGMVASNK